MGGERFTETLWLENIWHIPLGWRGLMVDEEDGGCLGVFIRIPCVAVTVMPFLWCVCVRVSVRVCLCMCVYACMCVYVCVFLCAFPSTPALSLPTSISLFLTLLTWFRPLTALRPRSCTLSWSPEPRTLASN